MTKSTDALSSQEEKAVKTDAAPQVAEAQVFYMSLHMFADNYASKYGVELMGGFFHVQEKVGKFADTEDNWHKAIESFAKEEVK